MNFETLRTENLKRYEAPNGFNHKIGNWSISDWLIGAVGELGESCNIAKKLNRVRDGIRGNKETPQELEDKFRKEIGDVLIYLDLIATSRGFRLEDAAREVFNAKSEEIGYPGRL